MDTIWVLNYLSLIQRGYPNVKQRSDEIGSAKAITVVTLEEQMKGWLNLINRYNDQPSQSEKLILAYISPTR